MPPRLSNRAKAFVYFLLMAGYVVGYGVLWTRVLKEQLATWPQSVSDALFIIGLVGPAVPLLAASVRYHEKDKGEDSKRAPAGAYLKLWRGEESLPTCWSFCLVSTFLVIAAGERLIYFLSHPSAFSSKVLLTITFTFALGLHVVATKGTWRSAARYGGSKIWVSVAQFGVLVSYAALVVILGLLVYKGLAP